MKTSDDILNAIKSFNDGYVFSYRELNLPSEKANAIIQNLNRLVKDGKLSKLTKGRYYKPKITEFGELKPATYEVVKDLLYKNKKNIGYLTGFSVFNSLFLTTQVSNTIQIACNNEKKALTRGIYKIRFIKQYNRITKENIPILQILDSIRLIKEIPDTTQDQSCIRISKIINELPNNKIELLKKLVLKYNASTKALTGAIINLLDSNNDTKAIFDTLNPASTYKFSISDKTLPTKEKWKIKEKLSQARLSSLFY